MEAASLRAKRTHKEERQAFSQGGNFLSFDGHSCFHRLTRPPFTGVRGKKKKKNEEGAKPLRGTNVPMRRPRDTERHRFVPSAAFGELLSTAARTHSITAGRGATTLSE